MVPSPAGRHDRAHIVATALDLLDRVGLPDLTMRRLAAELDVQASALYWHVANKQELLAAIADRILDRLPDDLPGGPDIETRLLVTSRAIRDALLAYRDGAEVVLSTAALRLGASRAHEALRAALDVGATDDTTADHAATAVLQFILGHATLLQQRMHADSHGASATTAEPPASDDVFDTGIRMLAHGFRGIRVPPSSVEPDAFGAVGPVGPVSPGREASRA